MNILDFLLDSYWFFEAVGFAFIMTIFIYKETKVPNRLSQAMRAHFSQQHLEVVSEKPLTFSDKLKYGIPVSFLKFYNLVYRIFYGTYSYTRIVDVKGNGSEWVKYITIKTYRGKVTSIEEFESYEI